MYERESAREKSTRFVRFERSVTHRSSLVASSGWSMWCATCGARASGNE